jgi:tetratricopeptide (TPR) repeat protein
MMDLFPKDPKKIRARIRRYERALRKEHEETGFYSDGYGKRFLLGPLYLLMDDLEGALQSFAWYEETFPDDSGDPMQLLCWTLALYRSGDLEAAAQKLRRAMFSNLYLIPRLLGQEQEELNIWHGSNIAELAHAEDIPPEVFALWDETALEWARETYNAENFRQARERYIAIHRALKIEPRGPKRTQLVDEAFELRHKS